MASGLIWRRCQACGQLTLVPATANVCWQCGAPSAGPRSPTGAGAEEVDEATSLIGDRSMPGVGPGLGFGLGRGMRGEPWWLEAEERGPVSRPREALTATEAATAERLLASVFSGGS